MEFPMPCTYPVDPADGQDGLGVQSVYAHAVSDTTHVFHMETENSHRACITSPSKRPVIIDLTGESRQSEQFAGLIRQQSQLRLTSQYEDRPSRESSDTDDAKDCSSDDLMVVDSDPEDIPVSGWEKWSPNRRKDSASANRPLKQGSTNADRNRHQKATKCSPRTKRSVSDSALYWPYPSTPNLSRGAGRPREARRWSDAESTSEDCVWLTRQMPGGLSCREILRLFKVIGTAIQKDGERLKQPVTASKPSGYIYVFIKTPLNGSPEFDLFQKVIGNNGARGQTKLEDHWFETLGISKQRTPTTEGLGKTRVKDLHQLDEDYLHGEIDDARSYIDVKIGFTSQNPSARVGQWKSNCQTKYTLLLLYGSDSRKWDSSIQHRRHGNDAVDHARQSPTYLARTLTNMPDGAASALAETSLPRPLKAARDVESTIHATMSDDRLTEGYPCDRVGHVHKEWFRIPASLEGIKRLDDRIHSCIDFLRENSKSTFG